MKTVNRILVLSACSMLILSASANAAIFTFSNLLETEFVSDQNSSNSANRFGAAGDANKLVGSVSSGRDEFIVIPVDLSSIPDTQTVTSATLSFSLDGSDVGDGGNDSVDSGEPINLFELISDPDTDPNNGYNFRYQSFGPDGSSSSADRADNVQWNGGIGEIPTGAAVATDFLGTQLSSIANGAGAGEYEVADSTGTSYTFNSSAAFVSTIQSNLADDTVWLVFGIDALDVGPDDGLRSFLRYAEESAELVVNTIPEPATLAMGAFAGLAVLLRRRSL